MWLPFPKSPFHQFSNTILPQVYRECFVAYQTKFSDYFNKECHYIWNVHKQIEKWEKKLLFLLGDNPAAFGRFLGPVKRNLDSHHIKLCEKGIDILSNLECEIEKACLEIQGLGHALYDDTGLQLIKKFHREQVEFFRFTSAQLNILIDQIQVSKKDCCC